MRIQGEFQRESLVAVTNNQHELIVARDGDFSSIDDDQTVWEALWAERKRIRFIAHTHPGGNTHPSATDEMTFRNLACSGFRQVIWPIIGTKYTDLFQVLPDDRIQWVGGIDYPEMDPPFYWIRTALRMSCGDPQSWDVVFHRPTDRPGLWEVSEIGIPRGEAEGVAGALRRRGYGVRIYPSEEV